MSVTLYKVDNDSIEELIEEIEAEKATEKTVWIKSKYNKGQVSMYRRTTEFARFFDTKQDAIEYLETFLGKNMKGLILLMDRFKKQLAVLEAYKNA